MEEYWADLALDIATFSVWVFVGAILGFTIARFFGGYSTHDRMFDYYGMFGAIMAAMWAEFRRQRHLWELKRL